MDSPRLSAQLLSGTVDTVAAFHAQDELRRRWLEQHLRAEGGGAKRGKPSLPVARCTLAGCARRLYTSELCGTHWRELRRAQREAELAARPRVRRTPLAQGKCCACGRVFRYRSRNGRGKVTCSKGCLRDVRVFTARGQSVPLTPWRAPDAR